MKKTYLFSIFKTLNDSLRGSASPKGPTPATNSKFHRKSFDLRMLNKRKITFAITLTLLFLLSCQATQKSGGYFGKDGVVVTLTGGIPTRIYTEKDLEIKFLTGNAIVGGFQDEPLGTTLEHAGDLDIGVKVWNKGTSFVRGAIYISGYDPSILAFEGQDDNVKDLQTYKDCTLDIEKLGFGLFNGRFQCQKIEIPGLGEVSLGLAANKQGHLALDLGGLDLDKLLGKVFQTNFFERTKLFGKTDISFTKNDAGTRFDIGFHNEDLDLPYASRGRLFLAAYSFIDFTMNGKGVEFILPPSIADYPGTNAQYFNFRGIVRGLPPGQPTADQTVQIKSCYLYSTYFAPNVCIDPDPGSASKKVCTPTRYSSSKGQGAPVAITSVQQETTPTKVYFKIDIEDVGKGQLYDPGKIQRCSPYYPLPVDANDLDTVIIGAAYIGKQRLQCTPPFSVRLNKKKGRFTCWYDLSGAIVTKSGYQTPLTLELWYGYSSSQQRTIQIKRV
ncbi:MAG TPA: hypothetical protein VJG90_04595 [Candidatus Nanoarchaeia archaeon]|nr:hypothetical protein [Candidatus Nanoarchaeia archaeon]